MRVTSKGQVTIPQHIRRFLGISTHSEVEFRIEGNSVVIEVDDGASPRGSEGESRFRKLKGTKKDGLSTAEWMAETRVSECS